MAVQRVTARDKILTDIVCRALPLRDSWASCWGSVIILKILLFARWCLSSSTSVTHRICNVTHQGSARGGSVSYYVQLGRHLLLMEILTGLACAGVESRLDPCLQRTNERSLFVKYWSGLIGQNISSQSWAKNVHFESHIVHYTSGRWPMSFRIKISFFTVQYSPELFLMTW